MIRNLESLFDYRKNLRVIILVFFSVVVLFSFTSNIVYGAGVSEGCGIFDIKSGCDLSGWMHLIIDVTATGLLALFLHSLASKHAKKLELIITNQENKRIRKEKFSNESLKNDFTALLFNISVINQTIKKFNANPEEHDKLSQKIKEELSRLENISLTIQHTSLTSSEVIKPEALTGIQQIRRLIQSPVKFDDGIYSFNRYDEIKEKVTNTSKLLATYN